MRYLKLSSASKFSTDLLRVYLVIFEAKATFDLFDLSRNDLISLVESAELKRRPKRSFQVVLGVDDDTLNWYLFEQCNITNASLISAKSVEEPKLYLEKKQLPYRVLYCSPNFVKNFFESKESSQQFLSRVLKLKFIDSALSIFVPLLFFDNKTVSVVSAGIICHSGDSNPSLTEASTIMSEHNIVKTESNISVTESETGLGLGLGNVMTTSTVPLSTVTTTMAAPTSHIPSNITSSQPNTTVNPSLHPNPLVNLHPSAYFAPFSTPSAVAPGNVQNAPLAYPQSWGAPGWYGSYAVKLDNIFNPNNETMKNNIEDVIHLLEFCNKNHQYRSEEMLVMAFLGQNDMLKYIGLLTTGQLQNLSTFCDWLRKFCRHDPAYYRSQFNNLTQKTSTPQSFFLELESLYRKSHSLNKQSILSANAKTSIKKQFLRGLSDERVKQALCTLPESQLEFDGPNGVVHHTDYFAQNLRDLYPRAPLEIANAVIGPNQINSDILKSIQHLTQQFSAIKSDLDKRPFCDTCKSGTHSTSECRASDKCRSQGKKAYNSHQKKQFNHNHKYGYNRNKNQGRGNYNNYHNQRGNDNNSMVGNQGSHYNSQYNSNNRLHENTSQFLAQPAQYSSNNNQYNGPNNGHYNGPHNGPQNGPRNGPRNGPPNGPLNSQHNGHYNDSHNSGNQNGHQNYYPN